ncbi:SDR family oxidoreductase [Microlunatus capsulatus]|uniref:Nucleoside-diphosphate-sugar epimerase n=1 Tax=Microlunatus capsulatus TaxID=99117 RepID=A0ABS4ZA32_9ACTN|nr:SDR family oxidoreductase [Microlunatus capsulatus]MBP2417911.1 nucleoside-diphosphate-sugar epimerase [Microlunatus capsulatus]
MKVFVTGASGWIGSAVVPELLAAGHQVVGLARSDASAAAVERQGAEVLRGSLDDLASLAKGAAEADGVIHLAFNHDFSDYAGAGRTERAALTTLASTLEGSGRPLLFAAGTAVVAPGQVITESDRTQGGADSPRGGGEALALGYADRGVRPVSLRFAPTVHGEGDHGFVGTLAAVARQTGVAGYIGDGTHRWSAVHVRDAARLVRLALEGGAAGSAVHVVAEEGVETRVVAEAIGHALGVPSPSVAPEDAEAHFGWIGRFFALDLPASSALTQQSLGWTPTGPTLLEDLAAGYYTR